MSENSFSNAPRMKNEQFIVDKDIDYAIQQSIIKSDIFQARDLNTTTRLILEYFAVNSSLLETSLHVIKKDLLIHDSFWNYVFNFRPVY